MKFVVFILLLTSVFFSANCGKVNKDVSLDESQINDNETEYNFADVKKANQIETLRNPYEAGQKDAQDDILNGKFFIKTNGDPTEAASEWGNVLKEKHGIEIYNFGCCFSIKVSEYVKGYNKISEVGIKKKFGPFVLVDTRREAEKLSEIKIRQRDKK